MQPWGANAGLGAARAVCPLPRWRKSAEPRQKRRNPRRRGFARSKVLRRKYAVRSDCPPPARCRRNCAKCELPLMARACPRARRGGGGTGAAAARAEAEENKAQRRFAMMRPRHAVPSPHSPLTRAETEANGRQDALMGGGAGGEGEIGVSGRRFATYDVGAVVQRSVRRCPGLHWHPRHPATYADKQPQVLRHSGRHGGEFLRGGGGHGKRKGKEKRQRECRHQLEKRKKCTLWP